MLKGGKFDDDAIYAGRHKDDRLVGLVMAGSLMFWVCVATFLYADGYLGSDRLAADAPTVQRTVAG